MFSTATIYMVIKKRNEKSREEQNMGLNVP
jgi:hypothetical protein